MSMEIVDAVGTEQKTKSGWRIPRRFTTAGEDVYGTKTWSARDARITHPDGTVVFEQIGCEFPEDWSDTAVKVVANKYFRGAQGSPERETSLKQLIGRVANTATDWGIADNYFADAAEAETFRAELTWLLLHQYAAFNSPVWFNCGVEPEPQVSACFINSVEDSMGSIMDLAKTEAMLFKYGSGAGCNLSPIRSSKEMLAGGGEASGPVSFMRGYDSFAGVIKSGGKTRRAAKMVMLDVDHPDIVEFINCKMQEEQKAWALIEAGYDGGFNVPGGAYDSIYFQNANHSVRVSDAFMKAVEAGEPYSTKAVVSGESVEQLDAREILDMIAHATHQCGDPGLQYDDTINEWHTCSQTDRIYGSNPCSEYMFLNDTACNLASLNLLKFRDENGRFDVEAFEHACEVIFTAQEIWVDRASYPTPKIAENSYAYRPIGLGYANLGALLMCKGLAYDSDEGRAYAGAITAIMGGSAYRTSARLAQRKGPFQGFWDNRDATIQVMDKHAAAVNDIDASLVPAEMIEAAENAWKATCQGVRKGGLRNAQATVLAPTGTIAFMMDCDTTGIEPDIALVKFKTLVGGGMMKLVNNSVELALSELGYSDQQCQDILSFIDTNDTIEGAPHLLSEHLPVFDCAFKPMGGERAISYQGHIKMMGAAQPFLSGAISKTVNMPEDCTAEEIAEAYVESWKLGLKAVAIYRENSKRSQPLSTGKKEETSTAEVVSASVGGEPTRKRLPDTRMSVTHKFNIGGHEGYMTVGLYEDGKPGEIFTVMAKEGSTVSGLIDGFSTMTSLALQYGVPVEDMVRKFSYTRFEPSGFTGNQDLPQAQSVLDYMFRWMEMKFGDNARAALGEQPMQLDLPGAGVDGLRPAPQASSLSPEVSHADGQTCSNCGTLTIPNGGCHVCPACGTTTGCG